jgi:hypothetical protein
MVAINVLPYPAGSILNDIILLVVESNVTAWAYAALANDPTLAESCVEVTVPNIILTLELSG